MLKIADHDGNAELNAMPDSDTLSLYDGVKPPTCEDAPNGTLLISYTLASPWAYPAAFGVRNVKGLPLDADVIADGTARYFRFENAVGVSGDSAPCNMQGLCGVDLKMSTYKLTVGETHTLTILPFVAYNDDEFVEVP
jgi:hypothetical protein